MSSTYPVLDNKPIDQWKVTELKEDLKRRKLTTKGLKDDLIKRLDEAIRIESECAEGNVNNGFDCFPPHVVQSEEARTAPDVAEKTRDVMDECDAKNEKTRDIMDGSGNGNEVVDSEMNQISIDEGESIVGTDSLEEEKEQIVQSTSVENSVVVSESVVSEIAFSGQEWQNNETQNKSEDSNSQLENEDSKPPREEAKLNSSDLNNQVFEVCQVKSDSISTDSISINEKNELKDNVIADDVKLELDVKPEMVQLPSSNIILDGGKLQSMDVEEPLESKVTGEETDGDIAENADMGKKNYIGCVGSAEKLNLDRSSGDDSMEEDALESKQIDSKFSSDEVRDRGEKNEVPEVMEEGPVGVMSDVLPADKKNC